MVRIFSVVVISTVAQRSGEIYAYAFHSAWSLMHNYTVFII